MINIPSIIIVSTGVRLAVTFIPMPVPKRVCRKCWNKWVLQEVLRTCFGRGMGMNIKAQKEGRKCYHRDLYGPPGRGPLIISLYVML